ncbi:MAG: asparagine--tRNA ligase [Euryarchaeota archaeon RBG_16_62_10]|nr:MAG: asparagine--tRNA ligase [Euryarchaeota archaeon RBG_16_62_10]
MLAIKVALSKDLVGRKVQIRGWVYRTRCSGGIVFAVVRDVTGIMQVTVKKGGVPEGDFEGAMSAGIESSVIVEGEVAEDKRAPGGFEVRASKFQVVGYSEAFPITEYQSTELLLDLRHLWIRSREQTAVSRVKASLLRGARDWFHENGYTEVTPPIMTGVAPEDSTTLFQVKYFDRIAYLSQSAQFYLESLIFSLEKVYSLTPSFRAEKSRTPRHLAEYWHLEMEAAWVDNEGNMKVQEELVTAMLRSAVKECSDELRLLKRDPASLKKIEPPFGRMKYEEAMEFLQKKGHEVSWGSDLGAVEEKALTIDREIPLFVVDYPKELKPFYMKESPDDPRTYKNSDMLAPEGFGEIIGGSERETDNEVIIEKLRDKGESLDNYKWYLELRKYGSVPHSGFGLGMERIVTWVCKLDHIRDAIPYPRTVARVYP